MVQHMSNMEICIPVTRSMWIFTTEEVDTFVCSEEVDVRRDGLHFFIAPGIRAAVWAVES